MILPPLLSDGEAEIPLLSAVLPPAVRFWRLWERTPDLWERMRRSPRSLPGFSDSLPRMLVSQWGFSKTHQSSLTLKGGSTSHLGLLPSGEKRKPLLLVARNHFILWLADHQRSSPAAELRFAVCDRMDTFRLRAADGQEAHSSMP